MWAFQISMAKEVITQLKYFYIVEKKTQAFYTG